MRRGIVLTLALVACQLSACALNPPRIVSISPSRDVTDVATNQAISISFDRPMNRDSVEKRFALSPVLKDCEGSKNCRFAWTGNTLMFIHTHVNFALSTAYTVAMHAGYADASGQQNTLDHSWHFTTEGRPMLSSVDPGDNAGSVAPDRNIVLSFNRAMRPDTMRAAVQLTPDTSFLLRTRPGGDGSQFEIIPLSVLQSNQAYTVSVDRHIGAVAPAAGGGYVLIAGPGFLFVDDTGLIHELAQPEAGREAFMLCRRRHFDVVVTNLGLPDTSGNVLIRAIRAVSSPA